MLITGLAEYKGINTQIEVETELSMMNAFKEIILTKYHFFSCLILQLN